MSLRFAPIVGLLLLGGCAYHVAEQTDRMVQDLARHAFDRDPNQSPADAAPAVSQQKPGPAENDDSVRQVAKDVLTASLLDAHLQKTPVDQAFKLEIPPDLPGSEAPVVHPKTKEELRKELHKLYPPLPPLPDEPKPLSRADGRRYTLAEFQEIAALNSPALKQAVSDVKAAEGNLIQARTYQNPTMGYRFDPSNDGETAGVHGIFLDQRISTGGKMKLAIAAAQKDYDNAELALKKARSDLATQVRSNYFSLLVAKETIRINRALSILTDDIYRAQVNLLEKGGIAAGYEPAPLRAQAYTARLALKQSITTYLYAWKQLVTAVGLRQLPLSEVAGRIDANIPYFDYDAVLAHVIKNHTDIRTAYNAIEKTRYNTKLAQISPFFSDVDFQLSVEKEFSLQPFQWFAAGQVNFTIPVWDRNRGNIIAAEAALIRASEQPHLAELNLANNLQNAYTLYKNNLDALEYYRRFILPDQVRAYRGVLERRQLDQNAQFGDLVQAQQTLATNVASYLGILNQLWASAITVADFLQTDDLFSLATPMGVPALPAVEQIPPLPCCHPNQPGAIPVAVPSPQVAAPSAEASTQPGRQEPGTGSPPQPAPPATGSSSGPVLFHRVEPNR